MEMRDWTADMDSPWADVGSVSMARTAKLILGALGATSFVSSTSGATHMVRRVESGSRSTLILDENVTSGIMVKRLGVRCGTRARWEGDGEGV